MAFDPFSRINKRKDQVEEVAGGLWSAAPVVGVGVWALQHNKITVNKPTVALGLQNEMGPLGRELGKKLKPQDLKEKVVKSIMDGEGYKKIVANKFERRAAIQAILTSLDADEMGIDRGQLDDLKNRLQDIAGLDDDNLDDALLKPLKDTIDTINTGNSRLRARVGDAFAELRKFKKAIVPSSTKGTDFGSKLRVGTIALDQGAFLDESSFLSSLRNAGVDLNGQGAMDAAQKLFRTKINRLKSMSNGVTSGMQLDVVDVGAGQKGLGLRLMSGKGSTKKSRMTIPLGFDLEQVARGNVSRPSIMRLGLGYNTPYVGPRAVADAAEIYRGFNDGLVRHAPNISDRIRDYGDFALDLLESEVRFNANGTFSAHKDGWKVASARVMEVLRSNLEVLHRSINTRGANAHQLARAKDTVARVGAKHNTVLLTNMENLDSNQQKEVIKSMSGPNSQYDPGVGSSRIIGSAIHGRQFGLMQFAEGSLLKRLRYSVGDTKVSRKEAPLISRIEQVEGRVPRFVAEMGVANQTASVGGIKLGAEHGSNPFIEDFSGDKRVLSLMDVTMGRGKGVFARDEGKGQYVTPGSTGLGTFETERTIPLLDPDGHNTLSSELLEKLKAQKGPVWYSKAELAGAGGYLGNSTAGHRNVKLMARETGAYLQLKEVSVAGGKTQYHIEVLAKRTTEKSKVFGFLTKGTVIAQPEEVLRRDISTYNLPGENKDVFQDMLEGTIEDSSNPTRLGKGQHVLQNVIIGSGDMLKKSVISRRQAAITMAAAVLKMGHEDLLGQVRGAVKNKEDMGEFLYRKLAGGVATGKVSPDMGGRALALFRWGGGFQMDGESVGGYAPEFVRASKLMDNVENDQGILGQVDPTKRTRAAEALVRMRSVAEVGLGGGVDTIVPGTGHGDYGIGVGSVEPRTINYLKSMLRDTGFSQNETVTLLSDILSRKIGGAAGRRMIGALEKATMSSLSMGLGNMDGVERYTLDQVFEQVKTSSEMRDFMKKHKKGFLIDFKGNANVREAAINQASNEVLGNDRQMYILGGEALENMKGTEIKQQNGTIKVGSYYEERTAGFFENLQSLYSKEDSTKSQYEHTMARYKKDVAVLYTSSLHQITRGKIRGNTMNVLEFIGAEYGDHVQGLTKKQADYFKATQVISNKNSLYFDHFAFLNNLKEFMGTSAGKSEAGQALRDFFLNAEAVARSAATGLPAPLNGPVVLASRAPMLGKGNLRFAEMHRDPSELGASKDVVLEEIKRTKRGRKLLQKYAIDVGAAVEVTQTKNGKTRTRLEWKDGRRIESFGDILDLEVNNRDRTRELFEQLAENVQKWHTSTGGGSMYMVKDMVGMKSKTGGFKSTADIGMAASAIADADGDWGSMMRFQGSLQGQLSAMLKDEKFLGAVLAESVHTEVYGQFAKEGLKGVDKQIDETLEIGLDAMKETTTAKGTGPVDVALNKLRNAAIAMEGKDKSLANEALALLKGLEEHTTIKGKKLKDFKPWAERMAASVDRAFEQESITAISEFFRTEIFPEGSDKLKELYAGFEVDLDDARFKDKSVRVHGLNAVLQFMEGAIINAKANKIDLMATPNIAAANLTRAELGVARELATAIRNGTASVQSAMSQELGEQTRKSRALAAVNDGRARLQGMFDSVNTKTAGMVVGALALGAMAMTATRPDVSTRPLMVDGEMPSVALQNPSGDFLQASEARGMSSQGPSPYDLVNRPQGVGVTHMVQENGMSIRGAVQGLAGMTQAGGYINMMTRGNARGSVLINDTRRPITPNYLDRINGEY